MYNTPNLFDLTWIIDLNRIILYHIDIKIQRVRKYIPFFVINNMKCIKHYITSRFLKLGFVNELQGAGGGGVSLMKS